MVEEEQLPNAALAAAASFLDRNSDGKKFYGMDAELVQKVRPSAHRRVVLLMRCDLQEAFKWDPELEQKAVRWLEKLTGECTVLRSRCARDHVFSNFT